MDVNTEHGLINRNIYRLVGPGTAFRERDGTTPIIEAGEEIKVWVAGESVGFSEADFDVLVSRQVYVVIPGGGSRMLPAGRKFTVLPKNWRDLLSEVVEPESPAQAIMRAPR